ncbi:23319_t:CDS:2 [Racocetra persica]|uniref:23319_t:CDS:1 n=1 Tax=Racocetra persica TaxID=160502 RepID=A0ACA9L2Z6_9GLOM|nr:23319_t:CDS:2 [Racocetra persica]
MFSQNTKNLWNGPRGSVSSDSSQEHGASLFYSVPNLLADAEIRESISLQPSQVRTYNQYDDGDEYLGSDPVPETAFLDAPFSDNQNTQTAAAIYRNVPPTPTTRITSDTLSEGLLPSSSIPPPLLSGLSHRKFRDPAFAILFIIGLATMLLIGLILLFTTSSSPLEDYTRGTVFSVIYYSAGAIWLFILRSFAQPLIWGILVSVPFIFAVMFIWTVVASLTGPRLESGKRDPQDNVREQNRDASKDTSTLAFHKATTNSFGSICLGSLIMFTVQCLQYINEFVKKNSKLSPVFYYAAACMSCTDGLIDVLNNYTLIYVGISGESFCSSAMFTTKLFRRNLIFGLVNDSPTL